VFEAQRIGIIGHTILPRDDDCLGQTGFAHFVWRGFGPPPAGAAPYNRPPEIVLWRSDAAPASALTKS
jgi:hypothetical protein